MNNCKNEATDFSITALYPVIKINKLAKTFPCQKFATSIDLILTNFQNFNDKELLKTRLFLSNVQRIGIL